MYRVNCNVDLIVRGTSLLKALNLEPTSGVNHDVIHSVSELQESFAHSFSIGAAVERFFSTKEPYATVVEAASELKDAHVSSLRTWGTPQHTRARALAHLFLPSATQLRQGNVFTPVCQLFCSHEGRGVSGRHTPSGQTPLLADTPPADTPLTGRHPPPWRPLQRTVRILLECFLV